MLSVVSVHGGRGVGVHVSITHVALDLTVRKPPQTWDLATRGTHLLPRKCSNLFNLDLNVQKPPKTWDLALQGAPLLPGTCSNLFNFDLTTAFPTHTRTNTFIMKHVRLASGRFASCWYAFLFLGWPPTFEDQNNIARDSALLFLWQFNSSVHFNTIFYRFLLIIGGGHEWESASLQQIHAFDTEENNWNTLGLSRRRNSWLSTVSFLIWLWTVGQLHLYLRWKTLHKARRRMGPKQLLAIGLGTEGLGKAKSNTAYWRLFSHKLLVISGIRLLVWGNQWRSEANKSHLSLASICAQTEWNCLGENHRLH